MSAGESTVGNMSVNRRLSCQVAYVIAIEDIGLDKLMVGDSVRVCLRFCLRSECVLLSGVAANFFAYCGVR